MKKEYYKFNPDDAKRFAREHAHKIKKSGDEMQFDLCPYCHGGDNGKDKYTFSINMTTGQYNCLRASCAKHGNMISLAIDFGFSLGSEYDDYYFKDNKEYKRFIQEKFPSKPKAIEYMQSRGISEETTKRYGITSKPDDENILIKTNGTNSDGNPIRSVTPSKSLPINARNPEARNTPTATISPTNVGII